MSIVYVEARPKGLLEGAPVEDYVVEDRASSVLSTHETQAGAIAWAKDHGFNPQVARVRHFNRKYIPDHWQTV